MMNNQLDEQVEPDPLQVVGLTIKEAAAELGISEKTVRHRIKLNQLAALKIETPQGYQWRVYPDGFPSGVQVEPDPLPAEREMEEDLEPDPVQMETRTLIEALHMLDARQAKIDQLQELLLEASNAAAHWQARAMTAEQTVQRLLPAPKDDEPAEVTPAEPEQPRRPWWRRVFRS